MGQGNASATITAQLTAAGDGTHVTVLTDLTVTGKVAQFGRGVLADVSAKLLGQFVENLEQTVLVDALEAEVEEAEEALEELVEEAVEEALEEAVEEALEVEAALEAVEEAVAEDEQDVVDQQAFVKAEAEVDRAVRRIDSPEPEAIDLLEHAGSPVLKRLIPVLGVTVVVIVVWRLLRRAR